MGKLAKWEPGPSDPGLARRSSFSLDELARRANAAARDAEGSALYHACRAGIYLAQAKAKIGTRSKAGRATDEGWYDWLEENWHHSRRHADRCIELAEACEFDPDAVLRLEAKSVRGALACLGKPVDGRKSPTASRNTLKNNNNHRSRVSGGDPENPGVIDAQFTVTGPDPDPGSSPSGPASGGASSRAPTPTSPLTVVVPTVVVQVEPEDQDDDYLPFDEEVEDGTHADPREGSGDYMEPDPRDWARQRLTVVPTDKDAIAMIAHKQSRIVDWDQVEPTRQELAAGGRHPWSVTRLQLYLAALAELGGHLRHWIDNDQLPSKRWLESRAPGEPDDPRDDREWGQRLYALHSQLVTMAEAAVTARFPAPVAAPK